MNDLLNDLSAACMAFCGFK